MAKSSHKCLPESKDFMTFKGKRAPYLNPHFEVKNQDEPTAKHPIRRRHAMAGAKNVGSVHK